MSYQIPPHGTTARYHAGCRCQACVAEHSRYCKTLAYETHTRGPRTASVELAAAHLQRLSDQGWSWDQIAQAANCNARTISKIQRGEQKKASHEMIRRLLAADPTRLGQEPRGLICSIGFRRRGRALIAIGHNNQRIADALGMSPVVVSRLLTHDAPTITATTAAAMTRLYDEWSTTPGPSKRAVTVAAQRGWHGPDAWDDIDDPNAEPNQVILLDAVELNEERSAEVRLLAGAGNTFEFIAHRIGISPSGVRKILARDYPNLYLELTA